MSRLFRACLTASAVLALIAMVLSAVAMSAFLTPAFVTPVQAQTNFDRPGGDYLRSLSLSGDPAECALVCERDRRCRAWSFNYPSDNSENAVCWLKDKVTPRVETYCCVSGVRGAGVIEPRSGPVEMSIDRFGGDYRNFEIKSDGVTANDEPCRLACQNDGKCRAWTYARPGYAGRGARCFLKNDIKPPRRKPGFMSGVVR